MPPVILKERTVTTAEHCVDAAKTLRVGVEMAETGMGARRRESGHSTQEEE